MSVDVILSWRIPDRTPNLTTYGATRGLSLHAAKRHYVDDCLHELACSRTDIARYRAHGAVYMIRHVNPYGDRRCAECDSLREQRFLLTRPATPRELHS